MTIAIPEIEHTLIIPINTFGPLPIEAARPMQVVVQSCEEEYVASFLMQIFQHLEHLNAVLIDSRPRAIHNRAGAATTA